MLRFLGSVAALEELGPHGVHSHATQLSQALGIPAPEYQLARPPCVEAKAP